MTLHPVPSGGSSFSLVKAGLVQYVDMFYTIGSRGWPEACVTGSLTTKGMLFRNSLMGCFSVGNEFALSPEWNPSALKMTEKNSDFSFSCTSSVQEGMEE